MVDDSDYCYLVRSTSADLHGKTWGDANTECIAQGASLISIHSDGAQEGIHNVVKTGGIDVWIGLQANSKKCPILKSNFTNTQKIILVLSSIRNQKQQS